MCGTQRLGSSPLLPNEEETERDVGKLVHRPLFPTTSEKTPAPCAAAAAQLAVKKLGVHKSHALDAADAWAAMPPHTMAFNVQQMATDMFASKGNAEGYAMCVNH